MQTVSVSDIPDPSDRSLAAQCGGDVRGQAFGAAEQVLRMITALEPGALQAGIRFRYDPSAEDRQARTRTDLRFAVEEEAASRIEQLSTAGPLSAMYDFTPSSDPPHDYAGHGACCEIVRREGAWASDEDRREVNPAIPEHYYMLSSFEAKDGNDWMALDRLLDRFSHPACVEVMVEPADITMESQAHYRYLLQLMRVNRRSDDLTPQATGAGRSSDLSTPQSQVRDPIADDIRRDQEDLQDRMHEPHLHFAVRCWARSSDKAQQLAATVAETSLSEGEYRVLEYDPADLPRARSASEDLEVLDRPLLAPSVWTHIGGDGEGRHPFTRLSRLATVEELQGLFRLPVGRPGIAPRTMRRHTDPLPVDPPSLLIGDDIESGTPPDRTYPDDLGEVFEGGEIDHPEMRLDVGQLRKHMFLSGVSGSGKTVASFNLLAQLAHQDIPFLVIEPAKTEYRTFKMLRDHPDPTIRDLAHDMKVFSVGNEEISPFRFNPLAVPEGISQDEHIGSLLASFRAALPMEGPLEGLLAEAVEAVYEDVPEGQRFPHLKDLVATARRIVEEKGYSGEVQDDLSAALDVRIGLLVRRSLGKVFDCDESVPDLEELFTSNVVLEMDYLSREHACLMSLFILSSMREYVRTARSSGADLSHVTLIEEAHNIVGRSTGQGEADTQAFAAEYVSHLLAEMRALGEGLVIVDQLPSAVAPEVIKSTGTKLAHRLVATDDREDLGGTMLMRDAEREELARLRPGESYFYTEDLYRPRRTMGLGAHEYLALGHEADELPPPPDRDALRELIEEDDWFERARNQRLKSQFGGVEAQADHLESACEEAEQVLTRVREQEESEEAKRRALAQAETLEEKRDDLVPVVDRVNPVQLWDRPEEVRERARALHKRLGQDLLPRAQSLASALREAAESLSSAA
jgi:hypothetical protein